MSGPGHVAIAWGLLLHASTEMTKEKDSQPAVVQQALEATEAAGARMPESPATRTGRAPG